MTFPVRIALLLSLVLLTASPQSANSAELPLLFHTQDASTTTEPSKDASKAFNPASVVKIATTLWALERLGSDHRFETTFRAVGPIGPETGHLAGDLLVTGGGDPDFHAENVFLVAEALNRAGIREVLGELRLEGDFWIGWEGGSARRIEDPQARREQMRQRLLQAFDSRLWTGAEWRAWQEMSRRRGLPELPAPSLRIRDEPMAPRKPSPSQVESIVVHRSNPLRTTLRRFNAYSNNDIERFEAHLGSPAKLEIFLADKLEVPREEVSFSTLSGLGKNRLTAQMVVSLLNRLRDVGQEAGFEPADVLPRAGCDPGTLKNYPALTEGGLAASVVAKTGTLTTTDAGVSVLAGIAATAAGDVVFCVAAPRSGGRLRHARAQKESWLLELIESKGGPASQPCPPPLPYSDWDATILYPVEIPASRGWGEVSTLLTNPS